MDVSWEDARLFLAVAEAGGFGAAARQLGVGQPTVSRRVAELEYRLGQALFYRGRRGATLTEAGARMLPAAQQMARWAAELGRAVDSPGPPQGLVRVAAPPGLAYELLVPFCACFREQHPQIRLELRSQVEYLDLRRGQADLALRARAATEPGLVELHRLPMEMGVFVSRAYREKLGPSPRLEQLDWICWAEPHAHLPPGPQLASLLPGFQAAFTSDSYLVQHRACQMGLGAMLLPRASHPLQDPQDLVELPLPFPYPLQGDLYLVCPTSMEYVPRVRAVAQALRQQMERMAAPA